MELGFREDYLVSLMYRSGFVVERRIYADCTEANTYIGRPYVGQIPLNSMYLRNGWHPPEILDFRWTTGSALIPVPEAASQAKVRFASHKPVSMDVSICVQSDDGVRHLETMTPEPGQVVEIVVELMPRDRGILFECESWCPADLGSPDVRTLGIAVYDMTIMQMRPPSI